MEKKIDITIKDLEGTIKESQELSDLKNGFSNRIINKLKKLLDN